MKTTISVIVLLTWFASIDGYKNEWYVHVPEGEEAAKKVAVDTGCQYGHEIIPGENYFLLHCHHVNRRSPDPHTATHQDIEDHKHVNHTEQQKVISRKKRHEWGMGFGQEQSYDGIWAAATVGDATPADSIQDKMYMNDQMWPLMWYLNRGDKLDMNVREAWEMGITGKGIVVSILDDGIETDNPDLVANYDPEASYDVNNNDADPTPRYDSGNSNRHGTRCAGEVSASANNSICGVGIAFNSRIGGVRMLDGAVTDAVEARSLSLNNQHIDIYSASWGPDDDGATVDGPGHLATTAFMTGVAKGRQGKGSIFVWASGNGGRDHDSCNCDGYTNSIWTLSVSSATENGSIPWYSEACSSTIATTYSSGSRGEKKVVTTDLHKGCTSSHTGTSASAPMAAGVLALVLEANPNLNWRDVQHITVRNCHIANLRATDWSVNSVGRNYSHSFGYGLMDASGMVKMAQKWQNVGLQVTTSVKAVKVPVMVSSMNRVSTKLEVTDHGDVNFLENVQAHVTIDSSRRGDLAIYLTSPHGTKSQLLTLRPHDSSRAGFRDWSFLTVFCWGENPAGTWELEVQNDGRDEVILKDWSLTFHGTDTDPSI